MANSYDDVLSASHGPSHELPSESDLLRAMLESSADEIWFCDPDVNLFYADLAGGDFARTPGRGPLPGGGAGFVVLRPDGTPQSADENPLQRSLRGEMIRGEIGGIRHPRTGTVVWRKIDSRPLRNAAGQIIGAVAVTRSTADRSGTDEELRRHDARMAAIAAASRAFADAGLDFGEVLDRLTRAVAEQVGDFCSIRLLDATGHNLHLVSLYHPSAAAAEMVQQLASTYHPRAGDGMFGDVLSTGRPFFVPAGEPAELRLRVPEAFRPYHDQRPIHALIIVPMRAHNRTIGTLTAWRERAATPYAEHDLILLQDLADQAALAVDNARLYEASQVANRSKANFLAIISHELRTPINIVLGYADLLELGIGGSLTERQTEAVSRLKAGCNQLRRIVDELITFAELDAGQQTLRPTMVRARRVAEDVIRQVQRDVDTTRVTLRMAVPDEMRLHVDGEKLRHILLGLATNAVRFTEEGVIELSAAQEGEWVRFEIADTGIGIARDNLERVFEPFWQAEDANTRRYGGTGLGLSISRRLARLMGGDIEVDSTPGHGSRFVLRIPEASAETTLPIRPAVVGGGG